MGCCERGSILQVPTKEYIINPNYSIPGIIIHLDVKLGSTAWTARAFNNPDYKSLSENTSLSRHLYQLGQLLCQFLELQARRNVLPTVIRSRYICQKYLERAIHRFGDINSFISFWRVFNARFVYFFSSPR